MLYLFIDNLLLMGIIIVNMIMALKVILSTTQTIKESYIGCYLIGILGIFCTYSSATYHYNMNELIDNL